MSKKQRPRLTTTSLLMEAWCEAAEEWKRLRSDPTERKCRVARAAWYQAVYGKVPPLPRRKEAA